MQLIWIRHGLCAGNLEKRYIGTTDEPLCEAGRRELLAKKEQGLYPEADWVIVSPKRRCLESAALLYPGLPHLVVPEFAECDFGRLEGKNYSELQEDAAYQAWIDSGGILPFPDGESMQDMKERCLRGMERLLQLMRQKRELPKTAVCVVHGGTIMAVLSALAEPRRDYYDWQTANGEGYVCEWDMESGNLRVIRRLDGKETGGNRV